MLKVVITIEDLKFTDTQKNNFTAVILDEKTGIYTHLGGEFSDDGKTFIFYSPYSGDYTLIVSENLKKINMSAGNSDYTVNGETFTNDVSPAIIDERLHLPLRSVAEALGVEIGWDDATKTVTLTSDKKSVKLVIGVPLPNELGTPQIIGDRTFVPLRYIAEQFSANVVWDAENESVAIYK